jgi:hypothetical protein
MGEAKRRRATAAADRRQPDTEASVQGLHAQAGGVLRHDLIGDVPGLVRATLAGNARALQYLRALDEFWRRVGERRDAADALLCITCDRKLTEASCGAVDIVTAERADPATAMLFGVCKACCAARANDAAAILAAILEVLPRGVWPDLRQIAPPSDQAGRA